MPCWKQARTTDSPRSALALATVFASKPACPSTARNSATTSARTRRASVGPSASTRATSSAAIAWPRSSRMEHPRRTVGFITTGRGAAPRTHCEVQVDGVTVGEVTSGMFSPTLEQNIGLALMARERRWHREATPDYREGQTGRGRPGQDAVLQAGTSSNRQNIGAQAPSIRSAPGRRNTR